MKGCNNTMNERIAKMIDHTLLKPTATEQDLVKLCEEAKKYNFASVCVNPFNVPLCWEKLKDTDVKTCTVIGFPLGANSISDKRFEAENACRCGADELDFVINIGMVKEHKWEYIKDELLMMFNLRNAGEKIVKVILETCLLTNEEIIKVCEMASQIGLDFVKTSTGFSTGGATVEVVELMANTVKGTRTQVKASGGIRTKEDAEKMIAAGASRIGTSNGVAIAE